MGKLVKLFSLSIKSPILLFFILASFTLVSCGKPLERQSPVVSGEISIADVPGFFLGGQPKVLFHLSAASDDDLQFVDEIWRQCAVFGHSDWVNYGPDASYREVVIEYGDRRLHLISWHQYETGRSVALSTGLTSLNGKTIAQALKDDDPSYVKKRETFDAIVAKCISRQDNSSETPTAAP